MGQKAKYRSCPHITASPQKADIAHSGEHTPWSFADRCHDRILLVFCPTRQRDRGRECPRGASRKLLVDQGVFYCAWGCFSIFCFGRRDRAKAKKRLASCFHPILAHTQHASLRLWQTAWS
ncbi:hypothetical protein IVB18_35640 [Bradyrhizobium sp. 186]|uniref:hypothetical protein n=1 Tax=Bradyrhizobium sp. 186 TaxID=2782654 RepID=UPI002000A716|nr:hypothetical protein [Bradyrhizobium sp. 186]UPK33505.1 hypothetical protein IVB18_35640 [Bradyrhizobium sp. 186]